ncbi:hypothetical protein [Natranaeroarchaeum sulfidigenes]|uniref:Uncharacterized protein n=1 Tax=Natranaeroarchaeum sulfidigenes TaxID=2784880 RepID=A0A897MK76_9EURY|nr:hypothetical protein [Natranaeroarchaeum sulfidigenes]QSG02510.1 hypothetical protein AArcS_1293 [Natranaeroarchaeum sulfidigenes]
MLKNIALSILRIPILIITIPVVSLVGISVISAVDSGITELELRDARSNHARFEGTWTPDELRLEKARRELHQFELAEQNHAAAEGAEAPPMMHAA